MNNKFSSSWFLKYKPVEMWAYIDNLFTAEECSKIHDLAGVLEIEQAVIGKGDNLEKNEEIRKNTVSWFDSNNIDHDWIFRRITDGILEINKSFWNFDIDYVECLQYTRYEELGDHYKPHVDMMFGGVHYRKLSISVQLDSSESYQGNDLVIKTARDDIIVKKNQGAMITFPSFVTHEVTPLLSGKRRSLVAWVCGPNWK
jgi:PKHD-type hydroxylase